MDDVVIVVADDDVIHIGMNRRIRLCSVEMEDCVINQKKKRTRERLGSRRQREKKRALGVPTGPRIDRAIASILLSYAVRRLDEPRGERMRAQLEKAVAKDCGSAAAMQDENRNLIRAVKQRISYLLEQQSQSAMTATRKT
jgi:vacuolar-type H+-ATPase subunit I/STV1